MFRRNEQKLSRAERAERKKSLLRDITMRSLELAMKAKTGAEVTACLKASEKASTMLTAQKSGPKVAVTLREKGAQALDEIAKTHDNPMGTWGDGGPQDSAVVASGSALAVGIECMRQADRLEEDD